MTGTAFAQMLSILAFLVLARLYTPAEFGIFSAWFAIVLFLSVILTASFEFALPIEADGRPRQQAVWAVVLTILFTSLLATIILFILTMMDLPWLTQIPQPLQIILVPTALGLALQQTWQVWAAAEGNYRALSIIRITQACSIAALQIAAGFIFSSASALGLAQALGIAFAFLISIFIMRLTQTNLNASQKEILDFFRRQYRFPLFSLPSNAINSATANLLLLIVAFRFGPETAGCLALTTRVLGAPIGLLGSSILDVFRREASKSYSERGECRAEYLHVFKILLLAATCFCILVSLGSKPFFTVVFGQAWASAGIIALWLLPRYATGFVASPLGYMAHIAGKQHLELIWQIGQFGMTFFTLYFLQPENVALQCYSIGLSSLYLIYLIMSYRFSAGSKKPLLG